MGRRHVLSAANGVLAGRCLRAAAKRRQDRCAGRQYRCDAGASRWRAPRFPTCAASAIASPRLARPAARLPSLSATRPRPARARSMNSSPPSSREKSAPAEKTAAADKPAIKPVPVIARGPAQGTLTATDLAPSWHAPVPLPPRREARIRPPVGLNTFFDAILRALRSPSSSFLAIRPRRPIYWRMAETIDDIVENFTLLDQWDDRYRYVIELGRTLPPLAEMRTAKPTRCRAAPARSGW